MNDKERTVSLVAIQQAAQSETDDGSKMILSALWDTVVEESAPIESALGKISRVAAEAANSVRQSVFKAMIGKEAQDRSGRPDSVAATVRMIRSLCGEIIPIRKRESKEADLSPQVRSLQASLDAARSEIEAMRRRYFTEDELRNFAAKAFRYEASSAFMLLTHRAHFSSRRVHRFDDSNRCERCKLSVSDLIGRKVDLLMDNGGAVIACRDREITQRQRPSMLFCSGMPNVAIMAGTTDDVLLY